MRVHAVKTVKVCVRCVLVGTHFYQVLICGSCVRVPPGGQHIRTTGTHSLARRVALRSLRRSVSVVFGGAPASVWMVVSSGSGWIIESLSDYRLFSELRTLLSPQVQLHCMYSRIHQSSCRTHTLTHM